jgi:D-amino peptidase
MEGLAGVVTGEQLGPSGFEYARYRELMTEEVLAAIQGARDAGAGEIVVSDSHGNGQNILVERLPAGVRIVRAWPRPLMMMEGIDDGFAAAIFVGYHTAATNPRGVRAHTMSSARLTSVRINGNEASEALINAAIAGHFGVPVVLVTGDDATIRETQALIGDLEGVAVKEAIGFHSALSITPAEARDLIRERACAALGERHLRQPFRIPPPIHLELSFKHYRPAELLALLPFARRTGARTISTTWNDMLEVSRFLCFALFYEPGLEP